MSASITHIGFSDESNWNTGRFRSLGLVTVPSNCLAHIENELRQTLKESDIKEFKWKWLNGARERFAAQKMCRFAIENACSGRLRVDVLVWDIQDNRHKIAKRDDIANLGRMYYHLFRNVLRARWPSSAVWKLYPDEHTSLNWSTLEDCLDNKSFAVEVDNSLFTGGQFLIRLRREFGIEEIQPVVSGEHLLVQLADLFAGLAVFSREKFIEYEAWLRVTSPQASLFDEADPLSNSTRSLRERFPVLKEFKDLCKRRRMGVSLKSTRGLWTPKPENPLNFWLYEPKHINDKAPIKG